MTYKELFFRKYANARGNIRKNVKAIDIWNSIEEFLRIVLEPKKQPEIKPIKSPQGKIPKTATKAKMNQISNPLDVEGQIKKEIKK